MTPAGTEAAYFAGLLWILAADRSALLSYHPPPHVFRGGGKVGLSGATTSMHGWSNLYQRKLERRSIHNAKGLWNLSGEDSIRTDILQLHLSARLSGI